MRFFFIDSFDKETSLDTLSYFRLSNRNEAEYLNLLNLFFYNEIDDNLSFVLDESHVDS